MRSGHSEGVYQPPRTSGAGQTTRRAFLHQVGAVVGAGAVLAALRGGQAHAAAIPLVRRVWHDRIVHRVFAGQGSGFAVRGPREGGGLVGLWPAAVYYSPVVETGFAFTHLGLRWRAAGPGAGALRFAVQTSRDGADWSPWLPLEPAGALREGEHYTALARVPGGTRLRYRVQFPERPGTVLEQLALSYLNPYDGPEHPVSAEALVPAPQFPFPFRSREEWGADESLRFDAEGQELWPRMFVPVKKLVVHHTATTNDYTDAAAEVRAIYVYHAKGLEWGDIGYNALIGRDGVVYEGRRGRGPAWGGPREPLSPGVVAGHARFHNYGTAGYALIGHFAATPLPDLMRERLVDLLTFEARRHGVDPLGDGDFLRHDGIWHRAVANVSGHRDLVKTECPGDQVYRLLPELRAAVAARLGGPRAAAGRALFTLAPPPAAVTRRTLAAAWAGAGGPPPGWCFAYYLERWERAGPFDIVPADNRPAWSPFLPVSAAFLVDLAPGHYTLHLRGRDPSGQEALYETHTTFHVTDEIVVDNEDQGQTQRIGAWTVTTEGEGIYGESYETAPPGRGERVFRWLPLISETGWYEVWARWPAGEGGAADAPYMVVHADGIYRERRDQRVQGGAWNRLGGERLFRFAPGGPAAVVLANDADGVVAADAVKLVLRVRLEGR
jgi:hypothetical protein